MLATAATRALDCAQLARTGNLTPSSRPSVVGLATPDTAGSFPPPEVVRLALGLPRG